MLSMDYNIDWLDGTTEMPDFNQASKTHLDSVDESYMENRIALWLWRYVSPLLILLGTTGNCFCFIILRTRSFRDSSIAFTLSALAVIDTMVLYTALMRQWIIHMANDEYDIRLISEPVCKAEAGGKQGNHSMHVFLSHFFSHLSSWTLVVVTGERALTVSLPFVAKVACSKTKVVTCWLGIALALFAINFHIFFTIIYIEGEVTPERLECVGFNSSLELSNATSLIEPHNTTTCYHRRVCIPLPEYTEIFYTMDLFIFAVIPFVFIISGNLAITVCVIKAMKFRHSQPSTSIRSRPISPTAPTNGNYCPMKQIKDNGKTCQQAKKREATLRNKLPNPQIQITVRKCTEEFNASREQLNNMENAADQDGGIVNENMIRKSSSEDVINNKNSSSSSSLKAHGSASPLLVKDNIKDDFAAATDDMKPQKKKNSNPDDIVNLSTDSKQQSNRLSSLEHIKNDIASRFSSKRRNKSGEQHRHRHVNALLAPRLSDGCMSSTTTSYASTWPDTHATAITSAPKSRKVNTLTSSTSMLLGISVMFLVTTAPSMIYFLSVERWVQAAGSDPKTHAQIRLTYTITNIIYFLNNAINFLLYCLTGSRFRRALTDWMRQRKKTLASLRDRENRLNPAGNNRLTFRSAAHQQNSMRMNDAGRHRLRHDTAL